MPQTQHTQEEIARIAEEIYRRGIRDKVMPQHRGKFLTLDIILHDIMPMTRRRTSIQELRHDQG